MIPAGRPQEPSTAPVTAACDRRTGDRPDYAVGVTALSDVNTTTLER